MPQIHYRANLSSAVFPPSLRDAPNTVIDIQRDQDFSRIIDPNREQKATQIAQAIFLQDVIPTIAGYQGVGYSDVSTAIPALGISEPTWYCAEAQLPYLRNYRGILEGNQITATAIDPSYLLLYHPNWEHNNSTNKLKIFIEEPHTPGKKCWQDVTGTSDLIGIGQPFNCRGVTYAQATTTADGLGLYILSLTLTGVYTLARVSTAPVTFLPVGWMLSSYNYMLNVRTDGEVIWGSTTDPLDFTPSLVSGAGSIKLSDTYGLVTGVAQHKAGFYVFTQSHVISAAYTGNARYPFKFTPVGGSSRVFSYYGDVSSDAFGLVENSGQIRLLDGSNSQFALEEISEYLERNEEVTLWKEGTLEVHTEETPRKGKIFVHRDRYVLVQTTLDTLWWDLQLKRLGRIILPANAILYAPHDSKESLYIINAVGAATTIQKLELSFNEDATYTGIIILGKYQYARARRLELHEINVNFVGSPEACKVFPSDTGRSFSSPVTPYLQYYDAGNARYECRVEGQNISVAFTGYFKLSNLEYTFNLGGGR